MPPTAKAVALNPSCPPLPFPNSFRGVERVGRRHFGRISCLRSEGTGAARPPSDRGTGLRLQQQDRVHGGHLLFDSATSGREEASVTSATVAMNPASGARKIRLVAFANDSFALATPV